MFITVPVRVQTISTASQCCGLFVGFRRRSSSTKGGGHFQVRAQYSMHSQMYAQQPKTAARPAPNTFTQPNCKPTTMYCNKHAATGNSAIISFQQCGCSVVLLFCCCVCVCVVPAAVFGFRNGIERPRHRTHYNVTIFTPECERFAWGSIHTTCERVRTHKRLPRSGEVRWKYINVFGTNSIIEKAAAGRLQHRALQSSPQAPMCTQYVCRVCCVCVCFVRRTFALFSVRTHCHR